MRGTHIEYTRWVTDSQAVADCPLSLSFTSLGSLISIWHFFAPPKTPGGIVAEWAASKTYQAGFRHRRHSLTRWARVEKPEGGCEIYRLIPLRS